MGSLYQDLGASFIEEEVMERTTKETKNFLLKDFFNCFNNKLVQSWKYF